MKKIKELNVEVTFSVGLCDLEVSDKVYDQLVEAENFGLSISGYTSKYTDALDFLADEVSLDDALECEYEFELDIDEEE